MAKECGGKVKFRKPRTKKGWKRYCDDLWSYAVKLRDNFTCQVCNTKYPQVSRGLNAHHIKTKGAKHSFRYVLDNGISLCVYHHRKFAHAEPEKFKRWLIENKGQEWWNKLTLKSNTIRKLDYKLNAIVLEAMIRDYE